MSTAEDTADTLSTRRRRARFRAWHRGMREMDLMLGGFADREIAALEEEELAEFERLLEVGDQEFFGWLNGEARPPEAFDTPLLKRIAAYRPRP